MIQTTPGGFRRAIELDGNFWLARYWLTYHLAVTRHDQEEEEQYHTAQVLDPLNPLLSFAQATNAYIARRYVG